MYVLLNFQTILAGTISVCKIHSWMCEPLNTELILLDCYVPVLCILCKYMHIMQMMLWDRRHLPLLCYAFCILRKYMHIMQMMLWARCHLPLLYVGLEYGLTNNSKLAERFYNQALAIAPNDPFVLHEIGFIAYQSLESVHFFTSV